jgi:SAM-dependent methyltransferase
MTTSELAPSEWWLDKHPMAGWISGVAERSGIDREQVARVMEAAVASGIHFELPEAEAGFHITRYVMYQRIAQFFRGQRRDGRVLEVSGGAGAIAGMFAGDTTEYLSTSYPDVDVQDLSYPDSSFDYVVCDQVIEHIPEPQRAVDEIHRVLRPGGWLILATCFMDPVHTQPNNTGDYWRFTPAGLRHLVRGYREVYQCEGWGNREALAVVLFGGLQKYVPVSGHPQLEAMLAKNELDVPLSTWAIAQR